VNVAVVYAPVRDAVRQAHDGLGRVERLVRGEEDSQDEAPPASAAAAPGVVAETAPAPAPAPVPVPVAVPVPVRVTAPVAATPALTPAPVAATASASASAVAVVATASTARETHEARAAARPAPRPSEAPASKSAHGAPSGLVTVLCVPACDAVVENGRSLGPSPIFRRTEPVGSHVLRLRQGAREEIVVAHVAEGETTLVRHEF